MNVRDEVERIVANMTTLVEQIGLDRTLDRVEKRLIEIALELDGNNCKRAAERLKLNRTTLVEKRRKFRLPLNPGRKSD